MVGARQASSAGSITGAAYVFMRNAGGPGNWGQVKKIVASDAEQGDGVGEKVAISGDVAVVGARWENQHRGAV